jgi:hypothetical protein
VGDIVILGPCDLLPLQRDNYLFGALDKLYLLHTLYENCDKTYLYAFSEVDMTLQVALPELLKC